MTPAALADRIRQSYGPTGTVDPEPSVTAYTRYPKIRAIISQSPTDSYDDVINGRLTAPVLDQIIRHLDSVR